MADIVVTKEIAFVGMKVRRGRDWTYGSIGQDEGSVYGVITDITSHHSLNVMVEWKDKNGQRLRSNAYAANEKKCDLYIYQEFSTKLHYRDVKPGDWVEVVDENAYFLKKRDLKVGERYQVQRVGGEDSVTSQCPNGNLCLIGNKANSYWFGAEGFKKCDPPTEKIKVGDWVEVVNMTYWATQGKLSLGQKYEVAELGGASIRVKNPPGTDYLIEITAFKKCEAPSVPYLSTKHNHLFNKEYDWKGSKPKVGDKVVRIQGGSNPKQGYVYTVKEVRTPDIYLEEIVGGWAIIFFAPLDLPPVEKAPLGKSYKWEQGLPKIGDKVVRVHGCFKTVKQGDVCTVSSTNTSTICIEECPGDFDLYAFAPIELVDFPVSINQVQSELKQVSEHLKPNTNERTNADNGYQVRRPVSTVKGSERRGTTWTPGGRSRTRARICNH